MPTYTTTGDSYSATLPASGGQMSVRSDTSVTETLTDTVSTNGKFNPGDAATWSQSQGFTETIKGSFTYSGNTYPVFYDPDTGVYIVMGLAQNVTGTFNAVSVACYVAGTAIETAEGPANVEDLRIGDTVVTAAGECRPVKWIGRRSYNGRLLATNPDAQPIRFRAGSLGDGLPHRDLLVSPEHAMFLDGLLVPARCLVNNSTIVQERWLERVDYFHVELDSHDILLANGAPSESFLDDGGRGMFHNAAEFAALYPHATRPDGFCAPRVEQGVELEAIWRRLTDMAGEIAEAA